MNIFRRLYHNILCCHTPQNFIIYDGLYHTSKCKFCGKNIERRLYGKVWFVK